MQNSISWTRITSLYGFQSTSVVLCIENSGFRTKIACLHGSRTFLVILCMQNRVPSFRITSPYGSCPHLWFLHAKQRPLDPNNQPLWVPDMTCRFMHVKKRDKHQNYKSLRVPALICDFCMQNSDFWTRITSLYGSQPSSMFFAGIQRLLDQNYKSLWVPAHIDVFCRHTATFGPELQVYLWPRPHQSFCACKIVWLAPELLVSMGPSRQLWFLHAKQRYLDQYYKSLCVPALICGFVHWKHRLEN